MSRHPRLSAAAEALPASLFARLYERLARFQGDVIPLQIGDTYLPPAVRLPDLDLGIDRELYPYAPPQGWAPLVDRLVDKVRTRNQIPVTHDGVQVTCGATHALACAVGALLDPGEEIILLTPHWPLIRGIAQSRSVVPVEVPFTLPLLGGDDAAEVLRHVIRPQTAAIYLCTPNNPDGLVLDDHTLGVIAEVAQRHDLWVLADEAYEDYVYQGQHRSIASLPGMAERTVILYTFSKKFAMTGWRLGAAVGPVPVAEQIAKLNTNDESCTTHFVQAAGVEGLRDPSGAAPILAELERRRDAAVAGLSAVPGITCATPEATFYLFPNVTEAVARMGFGTVTEFATAALHHTGVSFCTRHHFGSAQPDETQHYIRLAYSGISVDDITEGLGKLAAWVGGA